MAGIHLEGFRVIGDPQEYARRYYEQGGGGFNSEVQLL